MPILQICSEAKKVMFASQINTGLSKSTTAKNSLREASKRNLLCRSETQQMQKQQD